MKQIKYIIFLFFMVCLQTAWTQTVDVYGQIESKNDVENIHIINKTSQKFTITNARGEFKISAKVNDTLVVSSIQNKLKTLVVDLETILSKKIIITLEEQVNQLDEVVIGKMLTGDLSKDMNNVEGAPVNAKKLGIPSYFGKLKTQSERRVKEATSGSGIVPLFPIINAISGRTKKLKARVKLERQETEMYKIKTRLSESLFEENSLHKDYIMDYFYFVAEDPNFMTIAKNKSDLEILIFLKSKLKKYKDQLNLKEN